MSPEAISYREFRDDDLEWVLQAMVASMRPTLTPERSAAMDDDAALQRARADFERYHSRARGKDKLIIAVRGGERIGMVWVTMEQLHQDPGGAFLLEVFVEPPCRNQGLGKELLDRAERWCQEEGSEELWLNVGGGNSKALGLYRSRGYDVASMHLRKRLSPAP